MVQHVWRMGEQNRQDLWDINKNWKRSHQNSETGEIEKEVVVQVSVVEVVVLVVVAAAAVVIVVVVIVVVVVEVVVVVVEVVLVAAAVVRVEWW